jgi:hypothetical protein
MTSRKKRQMQNEYKSNLEKFIVVGDRVLVKPQEENNQILEG